MYMASNFNAVFFRIINSRWNLFFFSRDTPQINAPLTNKDVDFRPDMINCILGPVSSTTLWVALNALRSNIPQFSCLGWLSQFHRIAGKSLRVASLPVKVVILNALSMFIRHPLYSTLNTHYLIWTIFFTMATQFSGVAKRVSYKLKLSPFTACCTWKSLSTSPLITLSFVDLIILFDWNNYALYDF